MDDIEVVPLAAFPEQKRGWGGGRPRGKFFLVVQRLAVGECVELRGVSYARSRGVYAVARRLGYKVRTAKTPTGTALQRTA